MLKIQLSLSIHLPYDLRTHLPYDRTASGPITSWQIDEETMETMKDIFLGSKIIADGNSSREIKKCLLLGRKAMTT